MRRVVAEMGMCSSYLIMVPYLHGNFLLFGLVCLQTDQLYYN